MSQRKKATVGGSKTRVQNSTDQATIKNAAGIVHRIIAAGGASAGTVTIVDGSTTQVVLKVPASDTISIDLGVEFDTSIKITNSATDIDTLVVFD